MTKPDLAKELKNVSEQDRKQIERAQEMLGPDPATMGFVKNLFWGNFREELVFPYPSVSAEEMARCDQLVAALDEYMRSEHPTLEIDQNQEIPEWAIKRLFDLGVMGMIIPREYGGGGYGLTSYNRILKRIGQTCGQIGRLCAALRKVRNDRPSAPQPSFRRVDPRGQFFPNIPGDRPLADTALIGRPLER